MSAGEGTGTSGGRNTPPATARLVDVTLDQSTILRWSEDVEHERRVAIHDLLERNLFWPKGPLPKGYEGPFRLHLAIADGRLVFHVHDEQDRPLETFRLALTPFRRIVKDYFAICESYYQAIRHARPHEIEAIDMGRRGLHDEGARLLQERLADKVHVDESTARRLFTLICVLHIRQ